MINITDLCILVVDCLTTHAKNMYTVSTAIYNTTKMHYNHTELSLVLSSVIAFHKHCVIYYGKIESSK
jgi:hypothetical protein